MRPSSRRAKQAVTQAMESLRKRGYYTRSDVEMFTTGGFLAGAACGAVVTVLVMLAL